MKALSRFFLKRKMVTFVTSGVPIIFGFSTYSKKNDIIICDDQKQQTYEWYEKGNTYWSECESSYDGVMGGYGELNDLDIKFSRSFLQKLASTIKINSFSESRVLDCGAGIGRVSKELLTKIFKKVDLVEQCPKYVEEAVRQLSSNPAMESFYTQGLQDFKFNQKYDYIWIQWVSNQLQDNDYVNFLTRCSASLTKNGVIIVKENICIEGEILDQTDSSVTRSDAIYKSLFAQANLGVHLELIQPDFPDELFEVKMFALKPIESL